MWILGCCDRLPIGGTDGARGQNSQALLHEHELRLQPVPSNTTMRPDGRPPPSSAALAGRLWLLLVAAVVPHGARLRYFGHPLLSVERGKRVEAIKVLPPVIPRPESGGHRSSARWSADAGPNVPENKRHLLLVAPRLTGTADNAERLFAVIEGYYEVVEVAPDLPVLRSQLSPVVRGVPRWSCA